MPAKADPSAGQSTSAKAFGPTNTDAYEKRISLLEKQLAESVAVTKQLREKLANLKSSRNPPNAEIQIVPHRRGGIS